MLIKKLLLIILNKHVRKSKFLVRLIFRVKIPHGERIFWDFTTLTLKSAMEKYVTRRSNILEIGTGPYAILSIYINKKFSCTNTASDIINEYTEKAGKCAQINGAKITVIGSDLFDNIEGKYDIIFFNSVYIAKKVGYKLGLNKLQKFESDWCGGDSGTEVTERFLSEARKYLERDGRVMLGINPVYSEISEIMKICERSGYTIENEYKKYFNPSVVLILK